VPYTPLTVRSGFRISCHVNDTLDQTLEELLLLP